MVASGCREWDCAGIPRPLEVVAAAAGAAVAVAAAAGTAVVRVVAGVVAAAEAFAVVVMCFASSWTVKDQVLVLLFNWSSNVVMLTCWEG